MNSSFLDIETLLALHHAVRTSGDPLLNEVEVLLAAEIGRRVELTGDELLQAKTKVRTLEKQAKVIKDAGF